MAYIFNPFTGSFDSSPTVPLVDGLYLPLSGGTLTGLLSSTDSVYINGSVEIGSGLNATLFVDDNLVGINTQTPNEALTIVGNVSATGTVYSVEGTSVNWQEAYTNLISNSAAYLSSVNLSFLSVSANWDSVYSNVNSNSANWDSAYEIGTAYSLASSTFLTSETDSQTLSFDETTKDLTISNGNTVSLSSLVDLTAVDIGVRALTANWDSTYTTVGGSSANWDSAYTNVNSNSANWDSAYTNLVSNSAAYLSSVDLSFLSVSANWDLTYTTVQQNSSINWNYQGTDLKNLSADWIGGNQAYTAVISNSANWNSVYNNVLATSGTNVKTVATTTPGSSAVTNIIAVSALPASPNPNTLYIVL